MRGKALLVAIIAAMTLGVGCTSAKAKAEERYAAGLRRFSLAGLEKARMTIVWEVNLPTEETKSEIHDLYIGKDLIVVAESNGFLSALSRYTGNFTRMTQLPRPFKFAPTLFEDRIYGICGHRLVTVDTQGKVDAGPILKMSPSAPLIVTSNYLFAPGSDGGIHKLTIDTANEVWPTPSKSAGVVVSRCYVLGDYIIYGNTAGEIAAVDMITGGRYMHYKARAGIPGGVVIDEDFIYAGSNDFYVYSLTLHGTLRWRKIVGGQVPKTPVLSGDVLYIAALGAGVQQLDKKDGKILWRNPGAESFLSDGGGYVFATGPEQELWLIDASNGDTLERLHIAEFDILPVNTFNDGLVYLANRSGRIVCLRAL
ncbi:MAG: outer membrane protein assembly factor BamB family protein [Planctomycetota bacterium]